MEFLSVLLFIIGVLLVCACGLIYLYNMIENFDYFSNRKIVIYTFLSIAGILLGIYLVTTGNRIDNKVEFDKFISKNPDSTPIKITSYNTQPISKLDNKLFKNYKIEDSVVYKGNLYIGITTDSGIKIIKIKKDSVYYIKNTIDDLDNITVSLPTKSISTKIYVQNIADVYNVNKKERKKLLNQESKESSDTLVDLVDSNDEYLEEFKNIDTSSLDYDDILKQLLSSKYDVYSKNDIERVRFE